MKNISSNFRTIIVMFMMILIFSFVAKSQNNERVTPVLAGTATFSNGKAVVAIDQQIVNNNIYFVSLTPIGNSPSLAISNKGENSFTISGVSGTSVSDGTIVDYVVFVKFKSQKMENSSSILKAPSIIK